MMETSVIFCPRCQTQIIRNPMSGDYVHDCQGAESLRNEDILIIGDWSDYEGSGTAHSNILQAGRENKLFGTRAAIEGAKEPPNRTSRGFPTNRYRTRRHKEYIHES